MLVLFTENTATHNNDGILEWLLYFIRVINMFLVLFAIFFFYFVIIIVDVFTTFFFSHCCRIAFFRVSLCLLFRFVFLPFLTFSSLVLFPKKSKWIEERKNWKNNRRSHSLHHPYAFLLKHSLYCTVLAYKLLHI